MRLIKMRTWIQTISPDVTKYKETGASDEWKSGQATFMRNWPLAVVDSSDHSASSIADKFDITTLPFLLLRILAVVVLGDGN